MDLEKIYENRFASTRVYRNRVWKILCRDFFGRYVKPADAVMDLGCGYGEFINNIQGTDKYGMDLNAGVKDMLGDGVTFLAHDCSQTWPLPDQSLDVVFSSNFFEHLPDKEALSETFAEIRRCLRPGGRVIAMGPNINRTQGAYWDFWDHHLPLTERSMRELLEVNDFDIELCRRSFMPYTLVDAIQYPEFMIKLYLRLPICWHFFGKQFLIIATTPGVTEPQDSHNETGT